MKKLLIIFGFVLSTFLAFPQCGNIDFTSSQNIACKNSVIRFYAQGYPSGSNFSWFVDGTQRPGNDTFIHFFSNTGFSDIELQVTLPSSTICTVTKNNFIYISTPIIDSVVANSEIICSVSDPVKFHAYSPNINKWNWIIEMHNYLNSGDSVTHTFSSKGIKKVDLIVTDTNNCTNHLIIDSVVTITENPDVDFSASPNSGCLPLNVNFSPAVDIKNDYAPKYLWSFPSGNSTSDSNENPSVITYDTAGAYNVTLRVTLSNGCSASKTKFQYISVGDSGQLDMQSNITEICKGDIVEFYNKSITSSPTSISWNFYGANVQANSTTDTQFVRYDSSGIFDVKMLYDYNGCKSSVVFPKHIDVMEMDADFVVLNPNNCLLPHTASFQSTSNLATTGTTWFSWEFYDTDGTTLLGTNNLPNTPFKYTKYGSYSVEFKIRQSPRGCVDSILKKDIINVQRLKTFMLKMPPKQACINEIVPFSIPSATASLSMFSLSYDWTFFELDETTIKKSSNIKEPKLIYTKGGLYDYSLILDNGHGCRDSVYFDDKINIVEVSSALFSSHQQACIGENVTFTENSTPKGGHTNIWEFTHTVDSTIQITSSSTDTSFTTSFQYPGTYNGKLQTFTQGCSDITILPSLLEINGVIADFSAKETEMCPGDSTILTSQIIANENYTSNPDTMIYEWEAIPSTGVTFSDKYKASTTVKFLNKGCFRIKLYVTNGSGCTNVVSKSNFICVGTKAIFSFPSKICLNESTRANNTSLRATQYLWYANSSHVHFLPSTTTKNPDISIDKAGDYTITLISIRTGCSDSMTKSIHVQDVRSDFSVNDSIKYCATALIEFYAEKSEATTFIWDFGDGIVLQENDTHTSHYYFQNSGGIDTGFNIKLTTRTSIGCSSTTIKNEFVKIIGPVPRFSVVDNIGCNPFAVTFKDESINIATYFFLFGDGNFVENLSFKNHTYKLSDPNKKHEIFIPEFIAMDTLGCNSIYKKDTIEVYETPTAFCTFSDTIGCAPFNVQFFNLSTSFTRCEWDFNSDGIVDDTTSYPSHEFQEGTYSVTLRVYNGSGCVDSVYLPALIDVYKQQDVSFDANDTIVCIFSDVNFTPQVNYADANIKHYYWDFGELGSPNDTSTLSNPSYAYSSSGYFNVNLITKDEYGCEATFSRQHYIFVADSFITNASEIDYVSVENNKDIGITWQPYTKIDFVSYKLSRAGSGAYQLIYTSIVDSDTTFLNTTGISVANSSYKYKIQVENTCKTLSKPINIHNSIHLNATSTKHGEVDVFWNKYYGWNSVKEYRLYKKENGIFNLFATYSANDTVHSETDLCNEQLCYFVEAISPNEEFISVSNQICITPIYDISSQTIRKRTTVEDNKFILTEWIDNSEAEIDHFIIDRYDPENGWWHEYRTSKSPYFIDDNTEINKFSYKYRISSVDVCGYSSDSTNEATNSILLKVNTINQNIILDWNKYPEVLAGRMKYHIEITNKSGGFNLIDKLDPIASTYIDNGNYENNNRQLCYRVIANFTDSSSWNSISNEACISSPPSIFIPNAFSPNNDGINDVFNIKATSIKEITGNESLNYKMTIFDSWGEIIFTTNDLNEGWDGTYKGDVLQAGVYYYYITAMGLNEVIFHFKGNVTIIR
ncbi:MAG: PKD domain-containing protein [Bacteroidota bacterium]|nr:PKD domain-containing protein [Bacteroidota bacterium]